MKLLKHPSDNHLSLLPVDGERKRMRKSWCVAGAFVVAQCLMCIPAQSQIMSAYLLMDEVRANFTPHDHDGLAIRRPGNCGKNAPVKDSLFRDLGRGVSLVVLPSYLQNKGVAVNLIFIYFDNKNYLELAPDRFELSLSPSEKTVVPAKVLRRSIQMDRYDEVQEEVYLEFLAPEKGFSKISFSFPSDTISTMKTGSSPLKVKPFTFDVAWVSAGTAVVPGETACMYSPVNRDKIDRAN